LCDDLAGEGERDAPSMRSELDEFALVLGLFLINHFKGQLIIPGLGFYGA
jgi:hypothetical protein